MQILIVYKFSLSHLCDATELTAKLDSANIDKWRKVFAGKILEQSQVEYQQFIGEGKV